MYYIWLFKIVGVSDMEMKPLKVVKLNVISGLAE